MSRVSSVDTTVSGPRLPHRLSVNSTFQSPDVGPSVQVPVPASAGCSIIDPPSEVTIGASTWVGVALGVLVVGGRELGVPVDVVAPGGTGPAPNGRLASTTAPPAIRTTAA